MRRTTIPSLDVEVGDVIDDGGRPHRVTHVDRHGGWAWPIAFDDDGWAMALGPVLVEVRRGVDEDAPADGSQRPLDGQPDEPDA